MLGKRRGRGRRDWSEKKKERKKMTEEEDDRGRRDWSVKKRRGGRNWSEKEERKQIQTRKRRQLSF